MFTYSVTIQNESAAIVQLRNRCWAISNDATGATEEIRCELACLQGSVAQDLRLCIVEPHCVSLCCRGVICF